jgi:hypothetical protein
MQDLPPDAVTPFVFSDPEGKRWPRLRLILLVGGVLFFLGTVLFVQTLFVAPQMHVPFALRQLKGQLKALQKENPAGQVAPSSLLWQNSAQPAGGKTRRSDPSTCAKKSRQRSAARHLHQRRSQLCVLATCGHYPSLPVDGVTTACGLQIDADAYCQKLRRATCVDAAIDHLVGDSWQPEAIEIRLMQITDVLPAMLTVLRMPKAGCHRLEANRSCLKKTQRSSTNLDAL